MQDLLGGGEECQVHTVLQLWGGPEESQVTITCCMPDIMQLACENVVEKSASM